MRIDLEWGEPGAVRLATSCDAVIIVDVLSFSTVVDIATGRGATIFPFASRDSAQAAEYAESRSAALASPRREVSQRHPYSLSPASVLEIPSGTRLVLPSLNGSTLTRLAATSGAAIYAACLRNASAVARHVSRTTQRVGVVPAGERWPDHTLRVAVEDLLGAGAVIAALVALEAEASVEAALAGELFRAARDAKDLERYVTRCVSGQELIGAGYARDVALASQIDVSTCVPLLREDAYFNSA